MAFKVLLLAAVLGAANAGVISAPAYTGYASLATPTLTSQSSNTLRTFGNQGQISHEAGSIQTPFSSDTRSHVRVSNDAQILAAAPVAHAYASPVAYAHSAYAPAAAYASPVVSHAAYAPAAYASPVVSHAAYAPAAYASPVVSHAAYAPAAITKTITSAPAATQLLGVAYSAAPAVAHMTYSNGLGIAYSY